MCSYQARPLTGEPCLAAEAAAHLAKFVMMTALRSSMLRPFQEHKSPKKGAVPSWCRGGACPIIQLSRNPRIAACLRLNRGPHLFSQAEAFGDNGAQNWVRNQRSPS